MPGWFKGFLGRNLTPVDVLPDYARLYFENLRGEYQSLKLGQIAVHPDVQQKIEEVLVKNKTELEWNDLYTFDLLLAKLQPLTKLPRIAWNLRSRYRDVAGLREYEAYLASKPPELAPATKEEDLRADIEFLLNQLHLRYSMSPIRESVRDLLSKVVAYITLAGLLVIILFVVLANIANFQNLIRPTTFLVVLVVGAMGGLVSMQQRFQSVSGEGDPIHSISELSRGWYSIFLSPISGAIFAGVLYFAMSGGLLQGALFPKIDTPGDGRFVSFIQQSFPINGIELAKLMIWSFIAGFAERFVPDTLSRFIEKQETTNSGTA
jgi:hypothetical protein